MNLSLMLESKQQLFLFTDRASGRILKAKRSQGLDFYISGRDWICWRIDSESLVSTMVNDQQTWSPQSGLRNILPAVGQEEQRVQLLQRKIDHLLSMRANLHVVWANAKVNFEASSVLTYPIQRKNVSKLLKLLLVERKFLRAKMKDFFLSYKEIVENANSLDQLQQAYQRTVENVTIGGYAGTAREAGGAYGKNHKS